MINHLQKFSKPKNRRNLAVRVSPEAEFMIRREHPWIFENSIISQSHVGEMGDLAIIFDKKRNFLAAGLWDPNSPIRIRILQFRKPTEINFDWFTSKIQKSLEIRKSLESENTNGYRLIHGENDGFPGLVLDCYDEILVLKIYSSIWIPYLTLIIESLREIKPYQSLVIRLSRNIAQDVDENFGLTDGIVLDGNPIMERLTFKENGILFEVDPIHGHKTGFYLDQRENRERVKKLSAGKSVLNVFSYNGGFSLYAAKGNATVVTSVDINAIALESAVRNFKNNEDVESIAKCHHQIIVEDAFLFLQNAEKNKTTFDMVILDPPMFAQNQKQIPLALKNYQKLTGLGINVLNPGGILVQASCSSRISSSIFFETIIQAIKSTGRDFVEIERTGHPIDHPINFPEGEYLKCLFAKIK
jgi:23S rRNA (cytosine1962-C5)-methyltransferase